MTLTILILSLIGYKLFFQIILEDEKSFSELYTNSFIILTLYLFGFMDKLIWGPRFIIIIGLAFLSLSLIQLKRKKINPLTINFHWDLLFYLSLIGLFYIKTKGTFLNSWDEFSYWGLIDKEFFTHHSLPKSYFITQFKDYPPGQALFHYFFTNTLGFKEGNMYFAQAILLITPILGLVRRIGWNKFPTILLMVTLINFSIFIFGNGIQTLMIDSVVSVYFALFLIIFFFDYHDGRPLKKVPLLLTLACLPLLKQIAFILAFIVLGTWLLVKIFYPPKLTKKELLFSMGSFFSVLIGKFSWDYYILREGFQKSVKSNDLSFTHYIKDFLNNDKHVLIVTKNFFHAFTDTASAYSPWLKIDSINILWIFLFILIIIVVSYLKFNEKKFLFWQMTLFMGFIGYALIHLLVYCYGISEFDGESVSSFPRYMNIYILSWMIFLIYYFLKNSPDIMDNLKFKLIFFISILLLTSKGGLLYALPRPSREPLTPERLVAIDAVNKTKNYITDKQSKIMFAIQHTRGHEKNIIAYELYPIKTIAGCIGYGKPYYSGDVWTCDISEEEFKSYLKEVDLFYVHNPDVNFCQSFPNLFGKNCLSSFLYKVDKTMTGIALTKIF